MKINLPNSERRGDCVSEADRAQKHKHAHANIYTLLLFEVGREICK